MVTEMRKADAALCALTMIAGVGAVWGSRDWPIGGRVFPIAAGLLLAVLAGGRLIILVREFRRAPRVEAVPANKPRTERFRSVLPSSDNIVVWVLLSAALTYLLGMAVAIPLTTLGYCFVAAPRRWKGAVTATVFMAVLVIGVTDLLGVPLLPGVLYSY
jgi:hypothetical protein